MAAINLAPLPPNSGLGINFWKDLDNMLLTAISMLQENTVSEDSHDSSSDSLEQVNAFDPAVHTVTEFRAAVTSIIGSLSDVV